MLVASDGASTLVSMVVFIDVRSCRMSDGSYGVARAAARCSGEQQALPADDVDHATLICCGPVRVDATLKQRAAGGQQNETSVAPLGYSRLGESLFWGVPATLAFDARVAPLYLVLSKAQDKLPRPLPALDAANQLTLVAPVVNPGAYVLLDGEGRTSDPFFIAKLPCQMSDGSVVSQLLFFYYFYYFDLVAI
jgi:hypothetical protein